MADIIKHQGIVEKIDGSHVTVRIVQTSACSSCSAKGLCNASESKEKQIDVYEIGASYQIGEKVVLCGSTSMGMKAVFLSFGIPLLILLFALFLAMRITDGDALFSALVSLIAIVPYYIVIYLCKEKLNKTFTFTIEK
ncbi:MAG: SoxR reducing system RseC family protein [Tyzzerella sp.]|nr:SoxR reducing system RseC family protein [Tyzzerella sp.]MBQ4056286.1 SoxR reducing system RseC family protein [Bacteroidaceae bacterium]MBR6621324.1 SoxR reducing system RseC family protein [Bacteroides sp.]